LQVRTAFDIYDNKYDNKFDKYDNKTSSHKGLTITMKDQRLVARRMIFYLNHSLLNEFSGILSSPLESC